MPFIDPTPMDIRKCWEWESAEWLEWLEAKELTNTRKYRKCINKLETLVLKCMFELTKMNLSRTGTHSLFVWIAADVHQFSGYKMRKHIAKALQARSQAI
jgi:hypothetical protein